MCALAACLASRSWADAPGRPAPSARHAVLTLDGDLDARATADAFTTALRELDARAPSLILVELSGNRARPDLLHDAVRAMMSVEAPTAVWLADRRDRRVGPGMIALALAADHAGLAPRTTARRDPGDDLTALNPDIEDWAVVNLDLRSLARDLAERGPLDRAVYESALAPRSSLWVALDENGAPAISTEEPARGAPLVVRTPEGWSFRVESETASRLFRIGTHRTGRAFASALGARARPLETIEIESGLTDSHARCLELVERVRAAIGQADAALDVRAGRPGTTRIMPHEYHEAARAAAALVEPSRAAIAEIASLTETYPEILQMPPPPDEDTPTQIGGPTGTRLSAWRGAVRDLEYDLSRLDDRIETYRRR